MAAFTAFFQNNMALLFCALGGAVLFLLIFCIVLLVKINGEKKRYDYFMGANRRPSHNLEMKIESYFETSKAIDEKYTKLLDMVTDMDKTMKSNVQKVGLVRYNPFDEMGGNLCFALALLDGEDNGVVLNGIHSRTGSFTYAKPIEMGVSIYMLSDEEKQAVKMAQEKAYVPEHEKVMKVKFKPIFKRRYAVMDQQMELEEMLAEAREKIKSIGDVTMAEQEQIEEEETIAGKIAAAEETVFLEETALEEENAVDDVIPVIQEAPMEISKEEIFGKLDEEEKKDDL